MVGNYQNVDCSLQNKFIVTFMIIFGTLSFPIFHYTVLMLPTKICNVTVLSRLGGSVDEWLACWTRAQ